MKKTREQKGITLIALIITIVVLMILAAVAINSITNEGIISKAEGAANKYTEEQQKEQAMLDYYQAVLEEKLWTQNGTEITRKGQTTPIEVGDEVKLKIGDKTSTKYSANGVSDWIVFGVENGQLLLISKETVGSVTLYGREGYNNGVKILNDECKKYVNPDYAYDARSINLDDFEQDWYYGYYNLIKGIDVDRKLGGVDPYWISSDGFMKEVTEIEYSCQTYFIPWFDGGSFAWGLNAYQNWPGESLGLYDVTWWNDSWEGWTEDLWDEITLVEYEQTFGLRPIIYLNYLVDVEVV